ncbi:uncharacterized protein LOC110653911 [Hevea brasiliensis]|uniref:uncharacterized protein LOC110653911 n=1 Tax=Hevea brasiliensis TaxID=3981 RepID=UPI0025F54519|nr:uncharacterized protein LOC110653911 [Hevea brasiliensis]
MDVAVWRRSWFNGVSADDMVLSLIFVNAAVFMLWKIADIQFMVNNFTSDSSLIQSPYHPNYRDVPGQTPLHNFISGSVHTLITSGFSHFHDTHFVSNMIGLYIFGMNDQDIRYENLDDGSVSKLVVGTSNIEDAKITAINCFFNQFLKPVCVCAVSSFSFYFPTGQIGRTSGPEYLFKLYLARAIGSSLFYLVHKAFMVLLTKVQLLSNNHSVVLL